MTDGNIYIGCLDKNCYLYFSKILQYDLSRAKNAKHQFLLKIRTFIDFSCFGVHEKDVTNLSPLSAYV